MGSAHGPSPVRGRPHATVGRSRLAGVLTTVLGMGLTPEDLSRGAVYSRRSLLERGMHQRHFSSGALLRVLPSRYTRGDHPADLRAIALAAQSLTGRGAVVSGVTAAELFGFRLPLHMIRSGGASIHLRLPEGAAPRSTAMLTVHRRAPAPVIRHHGVTMSHPVVALQEMAARLARRDLVAAVDSLVADRFGTAYRIPLRRARDLASAATGRGAPALRKAVGPARERVWSERDRDAIDAGGPRMAGTGAQS